MWMFETKNIDLFNKVHIFEPMKAHIYVPNIRLIRLFSQILNYAKPRIFAFWGKDDLLVTIPYSRGKSFMDS